MQKIQNTLIGQREVNDKEKKEMHQKSKDILKGLKR